MFSKGKNSNRLKLAAAASAALLLSACASVGPGDPDTGSVSPTVGERIDGGEITIVVSQDAQPVSVLGSFANNWPWSFAVFETAVRVDPETQEVSPLLATDWTLAEDGMSIEMTFRDDATFHTGRAMTAQDVKFSYDSAADPEFGAQLGFIARQIEVITVTDTLSLNMQFQNPLPNLFEFLGEIPVIDSETVSGLVDGTEVIGTGPYVFSDWNPGASYRLERFAEYRDDSLASIEAINYEVIANSTAAVSAARTGRADIVYGLTTTDTAAFVTDTEFTVLDAGGVIYPVGMDITAPPFDDVRVRQAVLLAIDTERLNNQVFQGTGTITDLFWGPSTPGYRDDLATSYSYDPARALELMKEAGVSNVDVEVVFMSTPIQTSRYEIFANSMKEIGINTTAVALDPPTYIQRQVDGNLGSIFLAQHGQVGRSPVTMLSSLPTLREGNPSKFWNDEYETLRNNLILAADADSASAALGELSQYMIDEAFIASSIQAPQQIIVSSRLKGINLGSFGELFAQNLYLTKG